MKKKLSDMTLEELWQLFPIVLEPHSGENGIACGTKSSAAKLLLMHVKLGKRISF